MTKQTIENGRGGRKASKPSLSVPSSRSARSAKRTNGKGKASRAGINGARGAGNKKDQLIALLSRKGGACISVISERLGWQPHTVRAAISGLRKKGLDIATSKAPASKGSKTSQGAGETVYAIVVSSGTTDAASDGAAR